MTQREPLAPGEKVDLNTASPEELMRVDGIGEGSVLDIVRYRESCGGFRSVDELLKVPSVAKEQFDKIKEQVMVGA